MSKVVTPVNSNNEQFKRRCVGFEFDDLVKRFIVAYEEKHKITPKYYEVTNILASLIDSKGLFI